MSWDPAQLSLELPESWEVNGLDDVMIVSARPPEHETLLVVTPRKDAAARVALVNDVLAWRELVVGSTSNATAATIERGKATMPDGTSWSYSWRRATAGEGADVVVLAPTSIEEDVAPTVRKILDSLRVVGRRSSATGDIPDAWRAKLGLDYYDGLDASEQP